MTEQDRINLLQSGTEAERIKIVQELIDRLLYLPEAEKQDFIRCITELFKDHPVHRKVVWGIEIYNQENQEQ